MERLWAPWRMKFIDDLNNGLDKDCFLCAYAGDLKNDKKNLVIARSKNCFVVFNRYPYNCGHLMVVPKKHCSKISDLNNSERAELMNLTSATIEVLEEIMTPDGMNCGFNLGKAAGAGLKDHIHMHVVPRWTGDSNFFPIIGGTKSMPEYLDETFKRLKPAFDKKIKGVK